jgi:hypothetical protein
MTPAEFDRHTSDLTLGDRDLVASFIPKDSITYYDCVPYLIGSNTYSIFRGYKYNDGEVLIIFSTKYQGKYWKVYKAYGPNAQVVADRLIDWWHRYRTETDHDLGIHGLTKEQYDALEARVKAEKSKFTSKAKYPEDVFQVTGIGKMQGGAWSKLRLRINAFRNQKLNHSVEPINRANLDECQAALKLWVKQMKDGGAVQLNYKQYEYVLLNHSEPGPHVASYLHRVNGEPKAVVLANWISDTCFAHTASWADHEIKGLSEVSMQYSLAEIEKRGYPLVASGLRMVKTWSYKEKYCPLDPAPEWWKITLPGEKVQPADDEEQNLFAT